MTETFPGAIPNPSTICKRPAQIYGSHLCLPSTCHSCTSQFPAWGPHSTRPSPWRADSSGSCFTEAFRPDLPHMPWPHRSPPTQPPQAGAVSPQSLLSALSLAPCYLLSFMWLWALGPAPKTKPQSLQFCLLPQLPPKDPGRGCLHGVHVHPCSCLPLPLGNHPQSPAVDSNDSVLMLLACPILPFSDQFFSDFPGLHPLWGFLLHPCEPHSLPGAGPLLPQSRPRPLQFSTSLIPYTISSLSLSL